MKDSVLRQISNLQELKHEELMLLWRTLYGGEPPIPNNRAYLLKRLAYRIQEIAYGGLSDVAKNRMEAILQTQGYDAKGADPRRSQRSNRISKEMPVAGTQFIRDWNGERHVVTAVDDSFDYRGKSYRSLTAVAKAITGTHWNGPMFFGLKAKSARPAGGAR